MINCEIFSNSFFHTSHEGIIGSLDTSPRFIDYTKILSVFHFSFNFSFEIWIPKIFYEIKNVQHSYTPSFGGDGQNIRAFDRYIVNLLLLNILKLRKYFPDPKFKTKVG